MSVDLSDFFCELTTYFYRILLAKNIDFFKETSVYFLKFSPAALLIVDLCGSRLKWLFFELVRVWNFTIVDLSDSRLKGVGTAPPQELVSDHENLKIIDFSIFAVHVPPVGQESILCAQNPSPPNRVGNWPHLVTLVLAFADVELFETISESISRDPMVQKQKYYFLHF